MMINDKNTWDKGQDGTLEGNLSKVYWSELASRNPAPKFPSSSVLVPLWLPIFCSQLESFFQISSKSILGSVVSKQKSNCFNLFDESQKLGGTVSHCNQRKRPLSPELDTL